MTRTTRMTRARVLAACSLVVLLGCGGEAAVTPTPSSAHSPHSPHGTTNVTSDAKTDDVDARLAEVARVHGGAGPWAVAGYRMGAFALHSLGLERGSFDLEVTHYSPHEVQYACIADGASAATGASLGKLNLSLESAAAPDTHTVYRRRSTKQSLTLRVSKSFTTHFLDVPRERLGEAGREAMLLPDADVFEVVRDARDVPDIR